jgi:transposase
MSGEYQRAIRHAVPDAEICFDPFHVVRLGARAVDQVRRDEWNAHERSHTAEGRWVKSTRWSLLKAPERQTIRQLATLAEVQRENRRLYRAFCSERSCGCSTTCPIPSSRPHTWTPGWRGPCAHG